MDASLSMWIPEWCLMAAVLVLGGGAGYVLFLRSLERSAVTLEISGRCRHCAAETGHECQSLKP